MTNTPNYEIVSILQDAVINKGELGVFRSINNRGVIETQTLQKMIEIRRKNLNRKLVITNLQHDAYSHINTLLRGKWQNNPTDTVLKVLPVGFPGLFL